MSPIFAIPHLLVMGDSLSAAYGTIAPEKSWVALMENKISKHQSNYKIINASISGYTTQNGLDELPRLLNKYNPQIVIIALGSNDGLRGLDPNAIKKNLQDMILKCKAISANILLLGAKVPQNYGSIYAKRFMNVFDEIEKNNHVLTIPFFLEKVYLNPKRYAQTDGLHPNEEAQPLLLEIIWPKLSVLLNKNTK